MCHWSRMQSRHLTHSTALSWAFAPLSKDFALSVRERTATNYPPSTSTTLYCLGTSRVYSSSLLNLPVVQKLKLSSCVSLYNTTITDNDQHFRPWKKRSTLPTNKVQSLFILDNPCEFRRKAANKIFSIIIIIIIIIIITNNIPPLG